MLRIRSLFLAFLLFAFAGMARPMDVDVNIPFAVMKGTSTDIVVNHDYGDSISITINGLPVELTRNATSTSASFVVEDKSTIVFTAGDTVISRDVNPIPLWISILPPLIAIIMALVTKEVFTSLFIGLLFGATIIYRYAGVGWFVALFKGLFAIADTYIIDSLTTTDHVSIIVFSMMIGGMVVIVTLNGGMKGIVSILSRYATNRRSGQLITWLMGVLIFFDDYANTLIVGNTMRPVTDRLKISREKLAYIVDSTTAPVAAIAFITTWIGAELGYIQEGLVHTTIEESPYIVFLSSLKYSFYPIFTLLFMFILILMQRDFGPMLRKEREAIKGEVEPAVALRKMPVIREFEVPDEVKGRWYNAAIPVMVVIFGTIGGLAYTGWDAAIWADGGLSLVGKLSATVGAADTFKALLWSSLAAMLVAIMLSVAQRVLTVQDIMEGMLNGFKTMLNAIVILILAWSLAAMTKELRTADFITSILTDLSVSPYAIPAITFVLSSLISFSTGTSWGTMAIIYPLVLPSTWKIGIESGLDNATLVMIFHNVVASVLAGSVFGDHCSPISDTTILSSLSSSCNHISHVKTQMPYALTVGFVSLFIGVIPAAMGWPVWISYVGGIAVIYFVIRVMGKKQDSLE